MGTNSQGSSQAKKAVEPAESDSVSASISVLFRNRVPAQQGDDLDDGWGDDELSSRSAIAAKLPVAALAPARVPASLASYTAAEWPNAPLSRAPSVPEDETDWDVPPSAESTALSSCVRELAPPSSSGRRLERLAEQVALAAADSVTRGTMAGSTSAVSAPAIDITIEPAFQGTTATTKLNVDSGSSPDLTEVLSSPRSSRAAAREGYRATAGRTRRWLVAGAVAIAALGIATYVALRGTSFASIKAQDPVTAAHIPLLPHLAVPNPPVLDVLIPAATPALDEITSITGDSLTETQRVPRRRVRAVVSRPRPIESAPQFTEAASEPATLSSATAPVGVVDLMIAAPAPKAAEPLQPPPGTRPDALDDPQPSRSSK